MQGREVTLPAGPGYQALPAWAATPPDARRGAVVIHELMGRQPEIDSVVERFADHGYAAIGPDLFHGQFVLGCIRRAVKAIQSGQGEYIEQIRAARSWLCDAAKLQQSHIGIIGFCIGGGFALAAGPGFGAVSTNYGDVPPQSVLRGIGPTIGCYGGRDRAFGKQGDKLKARLAPLGIDPEIHLFPEVGHSFLTQGDHPVLKTLTWPIMHITWNPAVAEAAWQKIFAFFDKTLA